MVTGDNEVLASDDAPPSDIDVEPVCDELWCEVVSELRSEVGECEVGRKPNSEK